LKTFLKYFKKYSPKSSSLHMRVWLMLFHLHPTLSKSISSMTYSSNGSLYGEMRDMTTRNTMCCLPFNFTCNPQCLPFPFMHLWSPLKLADVKLLIECALTPNKVLFVWNLIQLLVNITYKRKFSRILNSIAITTGVTFLAHINKRQIDLTPKHIKEMNQHKELWSWQTSSSCPSGPRVKIEKNSPLSAFATWHRAIQQHCIR
jgi:hypothetical protein